MSEWADPEPADDQRPDRSRPAVHVTPGTPLGADVTTAASPRPDADGASGDWTGEHRSAADHIGDPVTDPGTVADPALAEIDSATATLDGLDDRALPEHADVFDSVHGRLQNVLADTDPGAGRV